MNAYGGSSVGSGVAFGLLLPGPYSQGLPVPGSGDPTYITGYNNARNLIRRIERDELLEELVKTYIASC